MKKILNSVSVILLLSACSNVVAEPVKLVQSSQSRQQAPALASVDTKAFAKGSREFAFDLYDTQKSQPGNLMVSPYSLSSALTMTYAGAQGNTATQMADALHLPSNTDVHAASNRIDLALTAGENEQLQVSNALFGDVQFESAFKTPFLDTLAKNYGAGIHVLDFAHDTENARQSINTWVSQNTHERIQDLIPKGSLTDETAFVITNAVYMNAKWASQFDANLTSQNVFHAPTSDTQVPTMHQEGTYQYVEDFEYQAIELPYEGQQLSMIIVLPRDNITRLEGVFTSKRFDELVQNLRVTQVQLSLPKFSFGYALSAKEALISLGMKDAFEEEHADFTALAERVLGRGPLYISDVHHKTFIKVAEKGTEAAAASSVEGTGATSAPVPAIDMTVNKPFMFVIRDMASGVVLFIGRVMDPH